MKAIEGMQPQINDMERRLGIMQSVEPVLENAIKTLQKVVDIRGMGKAGKSAFIQVNDDDEDDSSEESKKQEAAKAAEKRAVLQEGLKIIDGQQKRSDEAHELWNANKL